MKEIEKIKGLYEKLICSDFIQFPVKGKVEISNNQGVYIIYYNKIQVLHVGRTSGAKKGLNQRLLNHVRNQSSFSKLYMKPNKVNLRGCGGFKIIEVSDPRERALLEALTAGLLCPAHIGTGEKNVENN